MVFEVSPLNKGLDLPFQVVAVESVVVVVLSEVAVLQPVAFLRAPMHGAWFSEDVKLLILNTRISATGTLSGVNLSNFLGRSNLRSLQFLISLGKFPLASCSSYDWISLFASINFLVHSMLVLIVSPGFLAKHHLNFWCLTLEVNATLHCMTL